MEEENKIDHNLFIPPVGFVRSLPPKNREENIIKFKALGPIKKHEYDLDICLLSRQMNDLLSRYKKKYNGFDYNDYEKQIRTSVAYDLQQMGFDSEFYMDHYYCVIEPTHPSYKSYIGIFIALCNPMILVPLLQHHLQEFTANEKKSITGKDFLDLLEYHVCNFLRTNRFPEDYFAKHDKVMNWVQSKRDLEIIKSDITAKFEDLITALNKITGTNIPKEVVSPKTNRKHKYSSPVRVNQEMQDVLFKDLSGFFGKKSLATLKQIIRGTAKPDVKIVFNGQANQLTDVFRIYAENSFIASDKKTIAKWIVEHFLYFNEQQDRIENFNSIVTLKMLYGQRPPTSGKRIPLKGILKSRLSYYGKKTVY